MTIAYGQPPSAVRPRARHVGLARLHILFLDGAFEAGPRGRPVFRPGPHVTDDVGSPVAAIAAQVEAILPRATKLRTRTSRWPRSRRRPSRTAARSATASSPSASAVTSARSRFSLHAAVTVRARERGAPDVHHLRRLADSGPTRSRTAQGSAGTVIVGCSSASMRRPWRRAFVRPSRGSRRRSVPRCGRQDVSEATLIGSYSAKTRSRITCTGLPLSAKTVTCHVLSDTSTHDADFRSQVPRCAVSASHDLPMKSSPFSLGGMP